MTYCLSIMTQEGLLMAAIRASSMSTQHQSSGQPALGNQRRIKHGNLTITSKIWPIESENRANSVHNHGSHQPRVMNTLA